MQTLREAAAANGEKVTGAADPKGKRKKHRLLERASPPPPPTPSDELWRLHPRRGHRLRIELGLGPAAQVSSAASRDAAGGRGRARERAWEPGTRRRHRGRSAPSAGGTTHLSSSHSPNSQRLDKPIKNTLGRQNVEEQQTVYFLIKQWKSPARNVRRRSSSGSFQY
uniref:Uncharacterized protein n=1 Tax=Pipistrellus kuhlii TaxID=59472 RepID=A0A7J7X0G2_PIPKU|nr:hypothetical protein mPipKuh1_010801 [Pipistrellus kuhlii]